jgi:hypothetical protein
MESGGRRRKRKEPGGRQRRMRNGVRGRRRERNGVLGKVKQGKLGLERAAGRRRSLDQSEMKRKLVCG